MWSPPINHPLRKMFAGVTENTFFVSLGVADPQVVDYLSDLLVRFLHFDSVYRLKDIGGRPLTELAEMLLKAEEVPPEGRTKAEILRHVGDFTLFWTGLFPNEVQRLQTGFAKDAFVSYTQQGKLSYLAAARIFDPSGTDAHHTVLLKLSAQFELCAIGLTNVRQELIRAGSLN
jgi:hypothetical protein